jgi:hypothetical protein
MERFTNREGGTVNTLSGIILMEMQPNSCAFCKNEKSFRSPGFHQNHQTPRNSPHFTGSLSAVILVAALFSKDYRLARGLLLES